MEATFPLWPPIVAGSEVGEVESKKPSSSSVLGSVYLHAAKHTAKNHVAFLYS